MSPSGDTFKILTERRAPHLTMPPGRLTGLKTPTGKLLPTRRSRLARRPPASPTGPDDSIRPTRTLNRPPPSPPSRGTQRRHYMNTPQPTHPPHQPEDTHPHTPTTTPLPQNGNHYPLTRWEICAIGTPRRMRTCKRSPFQQTTAAILEP